MGSKNKIIGLAVAAVLLGIMTFLAIYIMYFRPQAPPPTGQPAHPAETPQPGTSLSPLDQFVKTQKELMAPETAQKLHFKEVEVTAPVPTKKPIAKLTMVPAGLGGGDVMYEPVIETQDGQFQILKKTDYSQFFKISSPDEALDYLKFALVKLGERNYDRMKMTISNIDMYRKECRDRQNNLVTSSINPLPLSQAKAVSGGYQVTWVYYSAALPAGYWRKVYLVTPDGDIQLKENPDKPFWRCGRSVVF